MHRRWWFFAFWLALVGAIIFAADTGNLGFVNEFIKANPGADKVCHFTLIGTLAFLLNQALGWRKLGPLMLGGVIIGVAMTCEEFSQQRIPGRSFDYGDMAANLAGVAAADGISRLRKRKRD